jgi:hypothetical protein
MSVLFTKVTACGAMMRPRLGSAAKKQTPRRQDRRYRPDRDDFSSNCHPDLACCLSMIFSENRFPLFGIML